MPDFFAALTATPPGPASPLSRYIVGNGLLYLAIGTAMYAGAGWVVGLVQEVEGTVVTDIGLVRVVGLTVGIIGWFYVMGGRTRADSFALATVVDRALLPVLLLPLWLMGEVPGLLALPFAILDPVLAAGAFVLWRRQVGGPGILT